MRTHPLLLPLPRAVQAAALCLLAAPIAAQGIGGGLNVQDAATIIDQKLGASVAADTSFVDDHGNPVKISDYLGQGRPIILNPQYFGCPRLCGEVVNGLLQALKSIKLQPGKDFTVLSVSFDHREQTELGANKKAAALEAYGRPGAADHWHFLTGQETDIRKLTNSVGYGFRWNQTKNDFDHRAALIFVSPSGKITRYLRGFRHDPQTFRLAIVEASDGKVGTALDRFYLSCYGYDPLTGTYSSIGPMVMSIGGALTLAALAALLFVLWRRERRQGTLAPAS